MLILTLAVVLFVLLMNALTVPEYAKQAADAVGAFYAIFVAFVAFVVTYSKRYARRAWANINQVYSGTPTSRRNPAVCYSGVTAGQPYLLGGLPAVALDTAANVANNIPTFELGGSFTLTVTAKSSLSPSTNKAINPGDAIYADGGTLDSASNMTYGFTLDANSGGTLFGHLDPTGPGLTSGTTATVTVTLDKGL